MSPEHFLLDRGDDFRALTHRTNPPMMMKGFVTTLLAFAMLAPFLAPAGTLQAQTTRPEWRRHTPLPMPLTGHATLLLPTGEVLIAGGITADGSATSGSWLYSPATGTFRPTLNRLANARTHHVVIGAGTAAAPKIFAIGGFAGSAGNFRGEASVELLEFDAAQGNWRWRAIGSLGAGRGSLSAAWDGADHVVVTGGYEQNGGAIRSGTRSIASDRININTLRVERIAGMGAARAEHATVRIIGETGDPQVLVAGGEADPTATSTQILDGTAWDPIANPPIVYRSAGAYIGDRAGIARAFGGFDAAGASISAGEWYDPKRGWRAAPRMQSPRARFHITQIAGTSDSANAYLAVGGIAAGGPAGASFAECEIFHLPGSSFPNGQWTPFDAMNDPASERRVAIGGDNLAVVFGGAGAGSTPLAGSEIFQPLQANDLDFGAEEVGRRSDSMIVTIENRWLLPVRTHRFRVEGGEFLLRGDTADFVIPAGGSRPVRVYFQPSAPGARQGRLLFDVGSITDTVRLAGTGNASDISVINTPVDLGGQLVNTGSTTCFPLLRNNGTDPAVIDSVVIDPPGAFRLISPKGRTVVLPGDTLEVCVEFVPGVRGVASAAMSVHIAARTFPAQIFGLGTRRFMTAASLSIDCDTVIHAPGAESSGFITIENPGDSAVTVQAPQFSASAPGLFRVKDPTIFPLTLAPGERRQIEVIFMPQRETREVVTVGFPNNGDSAAAVQLCFIARSRYLSVSQPELDFGTVCAGDSSALSGFITIENPGGLEPVDLLDADIDPAFTLTGFAPGRLGPREYITLGVRYTDPAEGPFNGNLRVRSSHGELVVPVRGIALPALRFEPGTGSVEVGTTAVVPVRARGLDPASPMTEAQLTLSYDPKLMIPRRIVALAGGAGVDEAASRLQIVGGGDAEVRVIWQGAGMQGDGDAFGVEFEILRGDGYLADVKLSGGDIDGFCMADGFSRLAVIPQCSGSGGLIRSDALYALYASPTPASKQVTVTVLSPDQSDVRLEFLDASGSLVDRQMLPPASGVARTAQVSVANLPAGIYALRAFSGEKLIATRVITVVR